MLHVVPALLSPVPQVRLEVQLLRLPESSGPALLTGALAQQHLALRNHLVGEMGYKAPKPQENFRDHQAERKTCPEEMSAALF